VGQVRSSVIMTIGWGSLAIPMCDAEGWSGSAGVLSPMLRFDRVTLLELHTGGEALEWAKRQKGLVPEGDVSSGRCHWPIQG